MGALIYLDDSNLWIEGKKVSAVSQGMALDIWDATETRTYDNTFKLDFGRVLKIANNEPIKIARFYGSRPPEADSMWKAAKEVGFRLTILDRNIRNKEKGVDSSMVADMMEDLYELAEEGDIFILITGDADYVPVIEKIRAKKFETHVLFWDHAASNLKTFADKFKSLNGYLDNLRY
ncbi:NYN domain-containing protein [Candidatus Magnetomoraceae bacterium gMMP-15]